MGIPYLKEKKMKRMRLCAVKVSSHPSSWVQPLLTLPGADDKSSLWSFNAAALSLL